VCGISFTPRAGRALKKTCLLCSHEFAFIRSSSSMLWPNRICKMTASGLAMCLLLPCARGEATVTTLVSLSGTNGNVPYGRLVQGKDGNFYGTTEGGGPNGYGTIFKMASDGTLTTLVSFDSTNGSGSACALLQGPTGDFYGTTISGGAYNRGTVFQMSP